MTRSKRPAVRRLRLFAKSGGTLLPFVAALLLASHPADLQAAPYENNEYGFRIDPGSAQLAEGGQSASDTFAVTIDSQAGWQIRVRLAPVDPATTTATLQQGALDHIADDDLYSAVEHFEQEFANLPSHGISVAYDYRGVPFRIVARFLVANHLRYIVQCNARAADFATHEKSIAAVLETFEIAPISPGEQSTHRLTGLARRCGSELDWAARWDAAATRARREKKLVLVVARFYPGFEISDSLAAGALTDPDIIALIRERYVPLRLDKADDTPFRAHSVYGLGPNTFGQALLLVSPQGEVERETFATHPWAVDDFLRDALPAYDHEVTPRLDANAAVAEARRLSERGELGAAVLQLSDVYSVAGLSLRAAAHRRLRNGEAALADLRQARELAGDGFADGLQIDEARVLTLTGATDQALELLHGFIAGNKKHPRVAEARYRIAMIALSQGQDDVADALLQEIVEQHGSERWAWKAAAALTSTSRALGARGRLTWPQESLFSELKTPRLQPASSRAAAIRDAIDYLVTQQQSDGSWLYPPAMFTSDEAPENPVAAAVSALVAYSLLPARAEAGVQPALTRAVSALVASRRRATAAGEQQHFMDYWVWAKTYQLLFLVGCLESDVGERAELLPIAEQLIEEITARQRPTGGWSYYITRDLASPVSDLQSISFVTAPVVLTLIAAREAGIEVPRDAVSRALRCLEAMRNPNDTFDYMGGLGIENGSTGSGGAAGRGPVCELALLRGGRGSLEAIRAALQLFAEQREGLAREQGKNLMHAGPDAQGSHYLLFDYAYAALAINALPPGERAPFRRMLLRLVNATRYENGAFVDNPGMGRACGTALALLALRELDPSRE